MQDLVRVGVADAAERTWIGQRALECVVLGNQPLAKLLVRSVEDFQSAGIVLRELLAAAKHVQRGAALRARFGQTVSVPVSNTKYASAALPVLRAPVANQCSRPAIIRCNTSH